MSDQIRVRRLTPADRDAARGMFAMMAAVFAEEHEELADDYLDGLLGRADLWAFAAFAGDEVVGGVTAHVLPMTRSASAEIFIYDLAVRPDHQRRGVGRSLVTAVRGAAAAAGIGPIFVAAENADLHALEFYRALGGTASAVTFFTF